LCLGYTKKNHHKNQKKKNLNRKLNLQLYALLHVRFSHVDVKVDVSFVYHKDQISLSVGKSTL